MCPLAQALNCQPSRGKLNGEHLNQARPAHWQQSKPVYGVVTAVPKVESVHPEEHEMGNILSMGLTEVHQLARTIHFSKTGEQYAKAK